MEETLLRAIDVLNLIGWLGVPAGALILGIGTDVLEKTGLREFFSRPAFPPRKPKVKSYEILVSGTGEMRKVSR